MENGNVKKKRHLSSEYSKPYSKHAHFQVPEVDILKLLENTKGVVDDSYKDILD